MKRWVAANVGWFRHTSSLVGARGACAIRLDDWKSKYLHLPRRPIKARTRKAKHPLWMRAGASSDLDVFVHTFLWDMYAPLLEIPEVKVIVDCGANVGYVSALFLNAFPASRVISIEPDPDNANLCRKNLAPYGSRAEVVEAAIWRHPGKLSLSASANDSREWARTVREETTASDMLVNAITMPEIIEKAGGSLDLLKMDIEGAELEVFRKQTGWLDQIRNIGIELHDERCAEAFFSALGGYEYELEKGLETTICKNLRRRRHEALG